MILFSHSKKSPFHEHNSAYFLLGKNEINDNV